MFQLLKSDVKCVLPDSSITEDATSSQVTEDFCSTASCEHLKTICSLSSTQTTTGTLLTSSDVLTHHAGLGPAPASTPKLRPNMNVNPAEARLPPPPHRLRLRFLIQVFAGRLKTICHPVTNTCGGSTCCRLRVGVGGSGVGGEWGGVRLNSWDRSSTSTS